MNKRIKNIEFQGSVLLPNKTVHNIKCFAEIDQLCYGLIKGYFICENSTSEELRKDNSIYDHYFNIEPQFALKYANTYRFNICRLVRHEGGEVRKFYFEAQEFENKSDEPVPAVEEIESVVAIFYIGHHDLFYPPIWLEPHWNGNRYRKDENKKPILYEGTSLKVEIDLNFDSIESEVDSIDGSFETIEQQLIVTINSVSSITDALKKAKDIVETLRALLSFSAKKRITYYKYEYLLLGKKKENEENKLLYHGEVLNGKKRITHKSGYKDRLFERFDDWQSFMRKAVPVYIEKKETYNLEEAIWMYIVALEGETYESSFMSYCTALESVKDSYLFHNKEKFKLNPNQQKKLRRILDIAIKGFGNENGIDSDIVNNIIDKISDIHNPSFKSILAKLFSQLSVVLSDLEPDKIFNFIPIRNELFHKGKISEKDGHQLILEKDRLRILIERILLRLLEHPARPEYAVSDQPLDERYFTKDRFIT